MNDVHVSIQSVSKSYGAFSALRDISLDIRKKELICLLGPSGCGKSTLLRIIAGLEQADAGKIIVGGKDLTHLPPAQRNIGMMFQSYALFPNLTAYENVAYGLRMKKMHRQERDEKVREVLALVDLEHARDKYPAQLSGGQQQRIALARAVALSPDFLLLDEPLSALDAKVRAKLRREIRALQEKIGVTTIMVTHDQEEALTMADRVVVMNNAEIVQVGTPQDVYEHPNSPFVADFIGVMNFLSGDQSTSISKGDGRVLAVRPEHIRVCPDGGNNGDLKAAVRDVEFCGAFYRVVLECSESSSGDRVMLLDVPAHMSQELGLRKNQMLALEFPRERLIEFEESVLAR